MRNYIVRVLLGLAFTLVVLAHVTGVFPLPYLERLEHIAYDARVRLSLQGDVDPRIVIVDIDEKSLAAEGHWPWRRDKVARLVSMLIDRYQADIVGFDMVFAEPQLSHDYALLTEVAKARGDTRALEALAPYANTLDRDRMFAEVLAERRVVLGLFFHTAPGFAERIGALPAPLFEGDGEDVGLRAVKASGFTANIAMLQQAATGGGFFSNPIVDSDGTFRRVPLLHEFDGYLYESLSLAMAHHYLGLDIEPGFADVARDDAGYPRLEHLMLGPIRIPIDGNGAVLVPYRSQSPGYPYVSATDVLNETVADPQTLMNAIVLVGTTAAGLFDHRSTPVESVFPGVEIHANVITGILDEAIKWRPAYTVAAETVAVLGFGLAGALVLPLLSPIVASAATWLLIGGSLALNVYLWRDQSHVLPVISTLLVLFGIYVMNMFYGFVTEARSRAQLRGLFGHYVPPELVEEMNKAPDRYTLDGEKRELSVLFMDIRGFTTISESLDPATLANLLNEFLTPMTRVVHAHRGTIDKYIGDAMMAFWGAPMEDNDHAHHAVKAALDMLKELEGIRRAFDAQGWPAVRVGIGINTGMMSVGNMGSEFRMAYTVLGDAVNLGARLEGLTRVYGVDCIVSQYTAKAAPRFLYRKLDAVRVKGKAEPVFIYEPVTRIENANDRQKAYAHDVSRAIEHYTYREWDEAEAIFLQLRQGEPDVELHRLYLERIANFRRHPPPAGWDGVYTFETK